MVIKIYLALTYFFGIHEYLLRDRGDLHKKAIKKGRVDHTGINWDKVDAVILFMLWLGSPVTIPIRGFAVLWNRRKKR